MFNLSYFKATTKKSIEEKRLALMNRIQNNPHHFWMKDDPVLARNLFTIFEMFYEEAIDLLLNEKTLTFIKSNGEMSCALSSLEAQHVIIIFPELIKLLRSGSSEHGLAIIAHEMGHIIYKHSYKNITTTQAQIEADSFACKIGLGEKLQEMLMEQPSSNEIRIRITYLTSEIVSAPGFKALSA